MELFILGSLAFFTCLVLPWINLARIGILRNELKDVQTELRALRRTRASFAASRTASAPVQSTRDPARRAVEQMRMDDEQDDWEMEDLHPAMAMEQPEERREEYVEEMPVYNTAAAIEPDEKSVEFNLGAKLPVWTGAVSLICAAFFLVKYSIDAGWLGPVARDMLGTLFGLSLIAAAGTLMKRPEIANAPRIARGLAGAGIVTLYFCLYAAGNLHHFLPPGIGFIGMAGITALSVALSLRHGQTIAAFGLIGGLLTPALVGAGEPNAVVLFGYLFLLFTGIFTVLAKRAWWLLAGLALAGLFVWTGFWFLFAFAAADSFIAVLFVMAICGIVLAATHDAMTRDENARVPAHTLNIMAIAGAAATIAALSLKLQLSAFDWSMLEILSLGCFVLARLNPPVYARALVMKMIADIVLLALLAHGMDSTLAFQVLAALTVVYAVLPVIGARRTHDPRLWAGMQAAAMLALYLIAYTLSPFAAAMPGGVWAEIALALAAITTVQTSLFRHDTRLDPAIREQLAALYAFTATAFVSIGLAAGLPWQYLPLAFAAQIAASLWIGDMTRLSCMRLIAGLLCLVFIGLNWEQIALFADLALSSFTEQPVSILDPGITQHPLIRLVLPAMMTLIALILHRRNARDGDPLSHILFSTALALTLDAGYILTRMAFHHMPDLPAGFIERGIVTIGLAGCGAALLWFAAARDQSFLTPWARGLIHLAAIRIVWFDLLLHNPFFDESQNVGGLPVFNGITMTYGIGLLLSLWIARGEVWRGTGTMIRAAYKWCCFILLFALITLTVRQGFHGAILAGGMNGNGEFYAYSAVWLITGLGLLAGGIAVRSKTLRTASLGFLLLAVGKVFLLDASELEGLYRVFSFLGLGLSLLGLSYVYTRFVFAGEDRKDDGGPWWF